MGEFVRVECSGCGHAMKAGAKFFGRRVKCPKCSDPLQIPDPDESSSQRSSSKKQKGSSTSSRSRSSQHSSKRSSQHKPTLQKASPKKRRKPAPPVGDPTDDDPFGFNGLDNDPLAEAVRSSETARLRTPTRRKQKRKKTERKKTPVIQYDDYDDDGYERYKPESSFDGSSMITGLLMIIGSILWIVVGLAAGYLFFYPFILLAIGIGTLFKGLTG